MPHPVLRWVGRIGLVIYLPLALSLFLWKKAAQVLTALSKGPSAR